MKGLYYAGIQYGEWSLYSESISCFEEIISLPFEAEITELVCNLLTDRILHYSEIGYWKGSERLIDLVMPLTEQLCNNDRKRELWLILKCAQIKNLIGKVDRAKADKVYQSIETFVDWNKEREIELYAYACFLLAKGEYEKLVGSELLQYADDLQDLAENCDKCAFNDKAHYYYLHAKC